MSQDLGDPKEKTLDESSDPEVNTFWIKVVNTDWAYTEPALNFLTDNQSVQSQRGHANSAA